jgi:hypothetical protein
MTAASLERRRTFLDRAGLLASLALCTVSVLDPDLPWHLSAARRVLETGALSRTDFLSWTMGGKPWIDFELGSELIFYGLLRLGGTPALWLFRTAALFGLLLMFRELLRLWRIPKGWNGAALPALAAALVPLFGLRPEIFSLCLFMLEFLLLERRRLGLPGPGDRLFVALHLAFYAVWANLHAGFPAGLLLCFCYGVGGLIARREPAAAVPLAACAAGFLGAFANPYGAQLYAVLLDHWRRLDALHHLIEEWKPPSLLLNYLTGYWLLIVFSFAGLLAALRGGLDLPVEHVALIVVFGLFGSRSIRTTKYAMLVIFPLGLSGWASLALSPRRLRALGLAAAAAVPFIAWRSLNWAGSVRVFGWPPPMEAHGPAHAVAFLRKEKAALVGLNLYNPYNWGGVLGYDLFPDYKVFIDGRYIFVDLLTEVNDAQGSPEAFRRFVDERDVGLAIQENDGLMLINPWDQVSTSGRPYVAYAWPRTTWALVYWDAQALVYVRRSVVSARWLKKHEFRCVRPRDLRQLGYYVVAGLVPLAEAEAEIERYRREIGDPKEVAALTSWLGTFKAELAVPSARAERR